MNKKSHFSRNKKVSHLFGHYVNDTGRVMIKTLQRNFRKAGYQVTSEQWIVLVWLFDEEGKTQQELCDVTYKAKPGISRILKNLEKNDLIIRKENPGDGRSNLVYLTEKCKKMEQPLFNIAKQTQADAIENIPEKALDNCREVLSEIVENLS